MAAFRDTVRGNFSYAVRCDSFVSIGCKINSAEDRFAFVFSLNPLYPLVFLSQRILCNNAVVRDRRQCGNAASIGGWWTSPTSRFYSTLVAWSLESSRTTVFGVDDGYDCRFDDAHPDVEAESNEDTVCDFEREEEKSFDFTFMNRCVQISEEGWISSPKQRCDRSILVFVQHNPAEFGNHLRWEVLRVVFTILSMGIFLHSSWLNAVSDEEEEQKSMFLSLEDAACLCGHEDGHDLGRGFTYGKSRVQQCVPFHADFNSVMSRDRSMAIWASLRVYESYSHNIAVCNLLWHSRLMMDHMRYNAASVAVPTGVLSFDEITVRCNGRTTAKT